MSATVWVVGDTAPQGRGRPLACPPGRANDAQAEKGLPATVENRALLEAISSRAILRHVQPFSQKPRTPTVAPLLQISLYGVAEAD